MLDSPLLEEFEKAKALFLNAQRILIISHKNPDADSVGANLALREALENMGKTVTSTSIDPVPESCLFLRKAETYVRDFNTADFDLFITVDCGGHKLMAFHEQKPELLDRNKTLLINIDHHPSNDFFGNINIVMPTAPATCFMLFLLFSYYGWMITPTMATSLLQGLYYDTGSFMHSNTSADCLRIAARLKALGADLERSVKEQFHTASIPKLRLWGRALSRAYLNEKQAVVTAVTEQDYKEEKATSEDLSGLVNYLNHVPQAKFCVLLTEDFKGNIKGSMRTQNEAIDLSAITGLFGGGGHKKASGFTVPGRLSEKRVWSIQ
jgi:bifunctional oligoribonuclease and PAP phosphatase NrnA